MFIACLFHEREFLSKSVYFIFSYPITIDELACSSNPCEHGGTCTDTENGGFNCQCRSGYIGTMCESRSADGKHLCEMYLILSAFSVIKKQIPFTLFCWIKVKRISLKM